MSMLHSISELLQETNLLLNLLFTLLLIYGIQTIVTNIRLPPGPWGLPLIGYSPFIGNKPLETFDKLAKKYGDIYSIRIGYKTIIVLSSYEASREVFVKSGELFTGVSNDFSIPNFILGKGLNVFVSEGKIWKGQRRFLSTCLRDFGLGRIKTVKSIQEEAQIALQIVRDAEGQPIDFINSNLLACMTFNVVAAVVFGRRYNYDDERLKKFIRDVEELFNSVSHTKLVEMFPFLSFISEKLTGIDRIRELTNTTFSFMDEVVREHEESFDPNEIRDIIDVYLKANEDAKATGKADGTFYTRPHLLSNLFFVVTAAMDGTAVVLAWILKIAASHPEAQKKVQEELDRIVGRQTFPTWHDRNQLPYTEAFLIEGQRFASNIPLGMMRFNKEKTTLRGYTIPKQTGILANHWTIHNDPKIWGDPERFRPERFLGDDGQINRMKDYVLNFGLGHRQCIGETFARMELFIFATAVFQSFTLIPPPNEEINLESTQMIQRRVKSCVTCAIPRD